MKVVLVKKPINVQELLRLADECFDFEAYDEALSVYLRVAEKVDDVKLQCKIGYMFKKGLGAKESVFQVIKWYSKAAAAGDVDAQFDLGMLYIDDDADTAIKWFLTAAQNGHNDAQYNIGEFYYAGAGVEKNHEIAFEWYSKASDGGNIEAMYMLGIMLCNGEGVKQDQKSGSEWIFKAAELGSESAKELLANVQQNS
jgi:hypothetical protein